jgi:NADPH:quinone reductase-like Zn-dependent oxidoreductase
MKAIVRTEYGTPDVLRLVEVERPVPGDDEVLIRVRAASINAADRYLMRGEPRLLRLGTGVKRPKNPRLGADVAGSVEAAGGNVTTFKPGDAVYGDLSGSGWGAFAEYVVAPAGILAPMPANLTFEQAAAVPMAAVTALQGLRDKGEIRPGQRVLIHGASGGVGAFAVQIAKALGAEVTAVTSPRNLELAQSLGADHVIDYTREDFSRKGQRYDLILAANGDRSLGDYRRALAPGGVLVNSGGGMGQTFRALLLGPAISLAGGKVRALVAKPSRADLIFLTGLIEAGQIAPVIDECFPLAETAAAFRAAGRPRGKVVITIAGEA